MRLFTFHKLLMNALKVEDVLKVGDTFKIKITEIDKQGRVNASHKSCCKIKLH